VTVNTTGEGRLGIVASGNVGTYLIDDLKFAPISQGHLECTGVKTFKTPFGAIGTSYTGSNIYPPVAPHRAATIASCDLFLDVYPTGSNNILLRKLDDAYQQGFTMLINTGGYLECTYDISHNAFLSGGYTGTYESYTGVDQFGATTGEEFIEQQSITGQSRVPLGRWTNIGFMHEVHAYRRQGGRSLAGQSRLQSVASSNRAFLSIDGLPVASEDTMRKWVDFTFLGYTGTGQDNAHITTATPFPTYVTDNTGTVVAASGLFCRVENIHINRPPSADLESSLYMDAARRSAPYFTPDMALKPGGADQDFDALNVISNTTTDDDASPGTYTQSVWNLDHPGLLTNWDHGSNRNHLLFSGSVYKETGLNPYSTDFGSTRFAASSYAKAPYSSSLERFMNDGRTTWTGLNPLWPVSGQVIGGCWVYARENGQFFELRYDETSTLDTITLEVISNTGIKILRTDRLASEAWSTTAYLTGGTFINEWHQVGFDIAWSGNHDTENAIVTGALVIDGVERALGVVGGGNEGAFSYVGNSQTGASSAILLGNGIDCNMVDAFIDTNPLRRTPSPVVWTGVASVSGHKGGIYNYVYYHGSKFTGAVEFPEPSKATVTMPPANPGAKETILWVGANEYANDEGVNLDGAVLYTPTLFVESESYHIIYDDSKVKRIFGATDSPIRIGFTLPPHAISLARIDSPSYTVPGAITTIDLSDSNPSNLSTFRGGKFTLSKGTQTQIGRLVQKDSNGGFERRNSSYSAGSFTNLGERNLYNRIFQATSAFHGWTFVDAGGSNSAFHTYDVIPGAGAGAAANLSDLDTNLSLTGGFVAIPSNSLHALGVQMAAGSANTGVIGTHGSFVLEPATDHLMTVKAYQPYYPGNSDENIGFTVVGFTGSLSTPVGENIACYVNTDNGTWELGSPDGYGGSNVLDPNFAPSSNGYTSMSVAFRTENYPGDTPTNFALWLSYTGLGSLSSTEAAVDFIVVDDFHVYEIVRSSASGSLNGVNSGEFSGQFDWVFENQADTSDLRVTSMAVATPELDSPAEAYYAYLLGRGDYTMRIPDAFPHATSGELTVESRSGLVDQYVSNLESIKKRIEVRGSDGKGVDDFRWDIVTSPFTYGDVVSAVDGGKDIIADGIGSGQYTGFLPDGVFSVVMISPELPNNGRTVFVHYPAYNLEEDTLDSSHREIFNPIPLMREKLPFESPVAGQFSVEMNPDNQKFYNVTIYGVYSGFSGDFS
jgi:hypothetical protein